MAPPEPTPDDVHAASLAAFPLLRNALLGPYPSTHVETDPMDGGRLLEQDFLAARVGEAARLWATSDLRVAATLWWYNASGTFTAAGAAGLLICGVAPDPRPRTLAMTLRRTGYVGYPARLRSDRVAGGAAPYGRALYEGFAPVLTSLAEIAGCNERALWAVLTDSLATRLLVVEQRLARTRGGEAGDVRLPLLAELAAEVTGALPPAPPARWDVVRDDLLEDVTYVRRASCCLFYAVPGEGKCANCPRQVPAERELRVLAAGGGT